MAGQVETEAQRQRRLLGAVDSLSFLLDAYHRDGNVGAASRLTPYLFGAMKLAGL